MGDVLINIEAEAELLGSLMQANGAIDGIADLVSPEDFAEPVHGSIYAAIVRQASLGKSANPVTLKSYFDADERIKSLGGVGYLARLTALSSMLAVRECGQLVLDLAIRRRMREGLAAASTACADLDATTGEIISHADAALAITGNDLIHQPTGGECLDEMIRGFADKVQGVTCGTIACLDALLGPMRPKQLIIGAGRPGMGKTALALSYGIGAAKSGHGVLFVSLEMSSRELATRMAADMCFDGRDGVQFSAIRDGQLNDWQMKRVCEVNSAMHGLPFQVIDASSLTTGRLNMLVRRHARRMAARGQKLDLVIVDYLQLLSPDSRSRSNYEAVSEVSRALKAMAKEHGLAVFALAQLSREVEKRGDRRPQLSDLRDSGQIEQDADAVLFLLRQEYYLRQAEPAPLSKERAEWEHLFNGVAGQIDFILAKRRNGVTGNATGRFFGAYQAVRG